MHLYLAAHIDMPCTMDFFGIKPMEVHPHHGDDHADGHDSDHDAVPAHAEPQTT